MTEPPGTHRHHPPSGEADLVAGVSLQQASRLLEVPEAAIRSWERRYQLTSVSQHGEEVRYSPDALRVLRRLRDYVAAGHGTAEAASVTGAIRPVAPERLVAALLAATEHLQPGDITHVLDTAQRGLGLDRTIDDVLLPALREIGQRWAEGRSSIAQEHAATEAIHAWLCAAERCTSAPHRPQPIVLACGPRDHHTLALESLGVLLRGRGWDCLLLGARTPAVALSRAITDVAPAAVVVVAHLPSTRRSAARAVRSAHQHRTPMFVAGNAFRTSRTRVGVPATYLGENVARAADLISATVGSGRLGR